MSQHAHLRRLQEAPVRGQGCAESRVSRKAVTQAPARGYLDTVMCMQMRANTHAYVHRHVFPYHTSHTHTHARVCLRALPVGALGGSPRLLWQGPALTGRGGLPRRLAQPPRSLPGQLRGTRRGENFSTCSNENQTSEQA